MKMYKSKNDDGYSLRFEITPQEAQRVELYLTWHSSDIKDYVEMLERLTSVPKRNPYSNPVQEAFKAKFGATFDDDFWSAANAQYQGTNNTYQKTYQYAYSASTQTPPRPKTVPAWCKTLGLKQTATPKEIKSRYRELAKKYHPDKGGDPKKFAEIQNAYEDAIR
jgi:hypothetical protein